MSIALLNDMLANTYAPIIYDPPGCSIAEINEANDNYYGGYIRNTAKFKQRDLLTPKTGKEFFKFAIKKLLFILGNENLQILF
jgi:hypothetical protein